MLVVNDRMQIPDNELVFTFSRSGGPGGQNVNKVNSKATLRWNINGSTSISADVRARFMAKYGNRVTTEGDLIVTSQRYRDQPQNVEDCLEKLAQMLREVLYPPRKRRPTKPTRGSREQRLRAKKHTSTKKQLRRSRGAGE